MSSGTDYPAIYQSHVEAYDAMVSAEDCDGNLPRALEQVAPLAGARAVEVGAGTGRVTGLLLERGARVIAIDRAPAMLALARRRLARFPADRWQLGRAEARALPVATGWADLAIEGWALGHLRHEQGDGWREPMARALDEMARATRAGGALVMIETLGTGTLEPHPPALELAELYDWLEVERGFRRRAIRTDYRFADAESAARAIEFFFGDRFAERVRRQGWARIPECTGVWSRARD